MDQSGHLISRDKGTEYISILEKTRVERIKRLDTTQVLWIRWKTSQLTTQRQPSHDSVWLEATVSTNPSQVRCSNLARHACTPRGKHTRGKQHGSKFRARHIFIFSYIVPFTSMQRYSPTGLPKWRDPIRKNQHFSEDFDPMRCSEMRSRGDLRQVKLKGFHLKLI